ncbi:MAG: hypothetical protein ACRCVU_11805 [Flavobacterium sp.]
MDGLWRYIGELVEPDAMVFRVRNYNTPRIFKSDGSGWLLILFSTQNILKRLFLYQKLIHWKN